MQELIHRSWVDIRVNALGTVYSAALAAYLVYVKAASTSDTGLSLYMAGEITWHQLWRIRLTIVQLVSAA